MEKYVLKNVFYDEVGRNNFEKESSIEFYKGLLKITNEM
jgi:hypothetical protein